MIVEIRGVSFEGLGAELMMSAIKQNFAQFGDRVQIAVRHYVGTYKERSEYGFLTIMPDKNYGWRSHFLTKAISANHRKIYGMVRGEEVDAVLDASGFSYSDQWGIGGVKPLHNLLEGWKGPEKKYILLPQAFGPFENAEVADCFRKCLAQIDLMFPREGVSVGHLKGLGCELPSYTICPDFTPDTCLEKPSRKLYNEDYVCISPNIRMLDKVSKSESDIYTQFLAKFIDCARRLNLKVLLVTHENSGDEKLSYKLLSKMGEGNGVEMLHTRDVREMRLAIGGAKVLIGSRFHFLASAMAQGVPAIGAGWSHKYKELFSEYGLDDFLLKVSAPEGEIMEVMERAIGDVTLSENLRRKGEEHRETVSRMWESVNKCLGLA